MASIFRNSYTRNGKRHYSKKWYIEYRDSSGAVKRVPGFVDKRATEQLAARLVRDAERRIAGMIDPVADELQRPTAEHLDEFDRYLRDKGVTHNYRVMKVNRIRKSLAACRFQFTNQLDAGRLHEFLAEIRRDGASIQTSNNYLDAMKAFGKWMFRNERVHKDPFVHLQKMNTSTDVRRERRALDAEEITQLLDATRAADEYRGLGGRDRSILYLVAVNTGLRRAELMSLTPESFDLQTQPPTVMVEAAKSKRRRQDVLPIRTDLAEVLRKWLLGRPADEPCWPGKWYMRSAHMLRKDLLAAGIPHEDRRGRVVDFHALRHTFISSLARAGVHPSVAKELARHSTIELTMDRYTHLAQDQLVDALSNLPPVPQSAAVGLDSVHAGEHAGTSFPDSPSVSSPGTPSSPIRPTRMRPKSSTGSGLGTACPPGSAPVTPNSKTPLTALGNRCSIRLSYGDVFRGGS